MDIVVIFIVLLSFLVVPPIVIFLACTIEETLWDIRDGRKITKTNRKEYL